MKSILLIIALTLATLNTRAQRPDTMPRPDTSKKPVRIRICAPSKHSLLSKPLWVFKTHNKKFMVIPADSTALKFFAPTDIQDIHVYNGGDGKRLYGDDGKNGAVEVTLKDKPRRNFKKLKQLLKERKVALLK